jgi:multiple sugar transport system substrate-binding protein
MLSLTEATRYLGGSMLSYRIGGSVFGLPIDAAAQHAVYRADLLSDADEAVPVSWNEALALGARLAPRGVRLGLAIKTPHAGLALAALMTNAGAPWSTAPDEPLFIDRVAFVDAYEAIRELFAYCHAESLDWNAIDLHEAMVAGDDIAYTPCVFGYGTYGEADYRRRLSFADFAGRIAPYHAGSVLGGAGLAVSRCSANKEAALEFVAFAASEEGQGLILSMHGQPGLAALWAEGEADSRFNGFFTSTCRSIEMAWTRPRHRGYIVFQIKIGEIVAAGLRDKARGTAVWSHVEPFIGGVNG